MNTNTKLATRAQATSAFREQVEELRAQLAAESADFDAHGQRDLVKEAGIPPSTRSWADVSPATRETYERLWRERDTSMRSLMGAMAQTRSVLEPLAVLLRTLDDLSPAVDPTSPRFGAEVYQRRAVLESVGRLRKMVDALGPELAKRFPTAQLDLIDGAVRRELDALGAASAPPPAGPARTPTGQVSLARPSTSGTGRVEQRPTHAPSGHGWSPAPVAKEPVLATLAKVPDLAAAAKVLAEQLGVPEARVLDAAARLDGPARARFTSAIRGHALLADFALGSLDYRRVGTQMTFGGVPGQDRTDHRTRAYAQQHVAASRPRQEESRRTLAAALEQALAEKDPAASTEAALGRGLLAELGLDAQATAGWAPKLEATLRALDEEAFVPLRALNDLMPRVYGRYSPEQVRDMQAVARDLVRAVVEGRYPESRLEVPANQAQLAVLHGEAEQARWLAGHETEGKGSRGQTLTSREALGFERFWATKIGGPSHGFDNMAQCVLSILGNVRTNAIIVEDADWHQPAARAYLRLVGNERGRPMLYLEDPQFDFRLRSSGKLDSAGIALRVVSHAIERARDLGADLVVSDLLRDALAHLGVPASRYNGQIVLEPSAVVAESSDSMLGHDQAQTQRLVTRPAFPFVEVRL